MKARVPRGWSSLSKYEKDKIAEVCEQEMERRMNIVLDIYMKMCCTVLHDAFGFGENRLMCFIGNWQFLFEKHFKLVKDGVQIEYLDDEMKKIFKKSGYPDEFFRNMFGANWPTATGGEKNGQNRG